ncbi:rhodanese-like domain-containing protein [Rubrivivax gelatinosus]|uniref:Rhodanese domain-containing protein n=1 Tax=Rubrivivax gelatinosus TaxID=28068 RepID=A0A4R2MFZ5_RUBGE|nr:rhodanese-like domain-containing protein [Rubrivivax gelatinosus]TCP05351.1 hypothetical protein EV684_101223 [Rubrivivax gelatinosus]
MTSAHDLVVAAKSRIHEVSTDLAEAAVAHADVLLDVREADEFAAGHLPGAPPAPPGSSTAASCVSSHPTMLQFCWTGVTGTVRYWSGASGIRPGTAAGRGQRATMPTGDCPPVLIVASAPSAPLVLTENSETVPSPALLT